jgi:hypothetical protein
MHLKKQIRFFSETGTWWLRSPGKKAGEACYRRNKNGQITGPENEHLTPSRGLTSASERRKPLFLRLPGVFLR